MDLPKQFYTQPDVAEDVVDRKALRKILLCNNGRIIAQGKLWDIKNKSLGAGVYRIYLEKWKKKGGENNGG